MKEIHLPPILFLFQWMYNLIRWSLGYYTCDECGKVKNVFKSKKSTIHTSDVFRGNYNYRTACNECCKEKGL